MNRTGPHSETRNDNAANAALLARFSERNGERRNARNARGAMPVEAAAVLAGVQQLVRQFRGKAIDARGLTEGLSALEKPGITVRATPSVLGPVAIVVAAQPVSAGSAVPIVVWIARFRYTRNGRMAGVRGGIGTHVAKQERPKVHYWAPHANLDRIWLPPKSPTVMFDVDWLARRGPRGHEQPYDRVVACWFASETMQWYCHVTRSQNTLHDSRPESESVSVAPNITAYDLLLTRTPGSDQDAFKVFDQMLHDLHESGLCSGKKAVKGGGVSGGYAAEHVATTHVAYVSRSEKKVDIAGRKRPRINGILLVDINRVGGQNNAMITTVCTGFDPGNTIVVEPPPGSGNEPEVWSISQSTPANVKGRGNELLKATLQDLRLRYGVRIVTLEPVPHVAGFYALAGFRWPNGNYITAARPGDVMYRNLHDGLSNFLPSNQRSALDSSRVIMPPTPWWAGRPIPGSWASAQLPAGMKWPQTMVFDNGVRIAVAGGEPARQTWADLGRALRDTMASNRRVNGYRDRPLYGITVRDRGLTLLVHFQ